MHHRLRMLMSPEGDSPNGGGAPPASPPAATPQAPGVTLDQVKGLLEEFKNSVNADTRRQLDGRLKKTTEPKVEPATPAEPKGASEDYAKLRARDRTFERSIRGVELSDGAAKRMERAFELEQPEDVATWVSEYIADFGFGKQGKADAPPSTPSPTTPSAASSGAPTAPATPAPPAPAPVPVADLERANVHPNKLTADQVARLGPQGTRDYVTKYFRKTAP